jgi:lipopolysaccharide export system protein LptA
MRPSSFPSPNAHANRRLPWHGVASVALGLGLAIPAAQAEKADRTKPLTMESDKPCTVDLVRQVSVCTGNVVIAQGTLVTRAVGAAGR